MPTSQGRRVHPFHSLSGTILHFLSHVFARPLLQRQKYKTSGDYYSTKGWNRNCMTERMFPKQHEISKNSYNRVMVLPNALITHLFIPFQDTYSHWHPLSLLSKSPSCALHQHGTGTRHCDFPGCSTLFLSSCHQNQTSDSCSVVWHLVWKYESIQALLLCAGPFLLRKHVCSGP